MITAFAAVDNRDDPSDYAGYRAHSRAKSTGTRVVLVHTYDAGLESPATDPDGDLKWGLICEGTPDDQHDGCIFFHNQTVARSFMGSPEEWCPSCQEKGNS